MRNDVDNYLNSMFGKTHCKALKAELEVTLRRFAQDCKPNATDQRVMQTIRALIQSASERGGVRLRQDVIKVLKDNYLFIARFWSNLPNRMMRLLELPAYHVDVLDRGDRDDAGANQATIDGLRQQLESKDAKVADLQQKIQALEQALVKERAELRDALLQAERVPEEGEGAQARMQLQAENQRLQTQCAALEQENKALKAAQVDYQTQQKVLIWDLERQTSILQSCHDHLDEFLALPAATVDNTLVVMQTNCEHAALLTHSRDEQLQAAARSCVNAWASFKQHVLATKSGALCKLRFFSPALTTGAPVDDMKGKGKRMDKAVVLMVGMGL